MIQGTVGGIAGAIGMPAFAGNAASSASSVLGSLGNLGSLFGGGSGGIMNGLSAWAEGGSVMNVLSNPGLYSGSELLGAALPGVGHGARRHHAGVQLFGSKGGPKTEGGYSNIAGLVASTNGRTYQNGFMVAPTTAPRRPWCNRWAAGMPASWPPWASKAAHSPAKRLLMPTPTAPAATRWIFRHRSTAAPSTTASTLWAPTAPA